jgi:site-specific DNA-cytosine methylase
MEQVAMPDVVALLASYRSAHAPFRNRVDYEVLDFYQVGVPQHRRRLVAGSPCVVARLRRAPRVHRCVRDVVPRPRGTHVKNELRLTNGRVLADGTRSYTTVTADMSCAPIDGPSFTILAYMPLRWATPHTDTPLVRLNARESAQIQTFPDDYALHRVTRTSVRGVGNALPPLVMQLMLAAEARPSSRQR